jgi:ankyrin repeat protein
MTPLGWAAALGNYELCEWLLDNKARVISTDKFKRAPLIMAVRNGHLKVATLLLQRGADWMQADSSSNTPLHFAAAYGWPEMIDLLIKTGADINAENSWRATPINIAMLKNHEGCVKKFLEYPDVDVNKKDDKGRTLLTLALLDLTPRTVDFVKFLLNKGADPNLVDTDGQGSLHYLANQDPHAIYDNWQYMYRLGNDEQKIKDEIQARVKVQLQLADLLLANNASRSVMDSKKRTPFALCLERDNIELLNKLMESVSLNNDPGILHTLASKILNKKYQEILHHLIQNDLPSEQTINVLDDEGFTPFLAYIKDFCTTYPTKRG